MSTVIECDLANCDFVIEFISPIVSRSSFAAMKMSRQGLLADVVETDQIRTKTHAEQDEIMNKPYLVWCVDRDVQPSGLDPKCGVKINFIGGRDRYSDAELLVRSHITRLTNELLQHQKKEKTNGGQSSQG